MNSLSLLSLGPTQLALALSLVVTACAPHSSPDMSVEKSGRRLFMNRPSQAALSSQKAEFLLTRIDTDTVKYFVNNRPHGGDGYFNSPVVHSYDHFALLVPFGVSFSDAFRWNLPEEIISQISQYDLDHLDILFTPQLQDLGQDVSLKPAFWMFPERSSVESIVGSPPEFFKNVLLGVFGSDNPIDSQVESGKLKSFKVHLHDGRVSPNTGHLAVREHRNSFGFYSLAIFEEQRRAAVTLHWLLDQAGYTALWDFASNHHGQVGGRVNSLGALIEAMKQSDSRFYRTTFLRKLVDLVR